MRDGAHLTGRGALQQDPRHPSAERGELVALARGAPALLVDAPLGAAAREAQQLVGLVQRLVAPLDYERLRQREQHRMPAHRFQTSQLLGGHAPPERLERPPPRRRPHVNTSVPRSLMKALDAGRTIVLQG